MRLKTDTFVADFRLDHDGFGFSVGVRSPLAAAMLVSSQGSLHNHFPYRVGGPQSWLVMLSRADLDAPWDIKIENGAPAVLRDIMGTHHTVEPAKHPDWLPRLVGLAIEQLGERDEKVIELGVKRLKERNAELEEHVNFQTQRNEERAQNSALHQARKVRIAETSLLVLTFQTPFGPFRGVVKEGPALLFETYPDLPLQGPDDEPDPTPFKALWQDGWVSVPNDERMKKRVEAAKDHIFTNHPDVIQAATEAAAKAHERRVLEALEANHVFRTAILNSIEASQTLIDICESRMSPGMAR